MSSNKMSDDKIKKFKESFAIVEIIIALMFIIDLFALGYALSTAYLSGKSLADLKKYDTLTAFGLSLIICILIALLLIMLSAIIKFILASTMLIITYKQSDEKTRIFGISRVLNTVILTISSECLIGLMIFLLTTLVS